MVAGDILAVVGLAIQLGQIIEEAFAFSGECQELGKLCKTIQGVLKDHESSLTGLPAISELHGQLEECENYLASCKRNRFLKRNPILESTFRRKIDKYRAWLDSWIGTTNLSILVHSLLCIYTHLYD